MAIEPFAPDTCTNIAPPLCTIGGTIYGYYPNLGVNAFFAAFFGICLIIQLGLGIRYKTYTFMVAFGSGCLGELLGYVGRIMMHSNPYDSTAFQIQICCLIMAPSFVAAGVYLTFKHIVITFGESWSRLPPVWYTRIFIAGDTFCLTLQGAGGGIAATAGPGSSLQDVGTNLMIAGVVLQVVVLSIFGALLAEYMVRTYRCRDQLSVQATTLAHQKSFRGFCFSLVIAFVGIFIRCIYRIPELSGGWRSELMRKEVDFIVLEGVMIVVSVLMLTVFHPGYCFPALRSTIGKKPDKDETSDVEKVVGQT